MTSIRKPGLPTSSHEYSTIRLSGSATSYRGTGTQNGVPPPPDKLSESKRGEPMAPPSRPARSLGRRQLFEVERQKVEFDEYGIFTLVLHPDRPMGVGGAHRARRQVHQVAMRSHQSDAIRPMIFDDEVGAPQGFSDCKASPPIYTSPSFVSQSVRTTPNATATSRDMSRDVACIRMETVKPVGDKIGATK